MGCLLTIALVGSPWDRELHVRKLREKKKKLQFASPPSTRPSPPPLRSKPPRSPPTSLPVRGWRCGVARPLLARACGFGRRQQPCAVVLDLAAGGGKTEFLHWC